MVVVVVGVTGVTSCLLLVANLFFVCFFELKLPDKSGDNGDDGDPLPSEKNSGMSVFRNVIGGSAGDEFLLLLPLVLSSTLLLKSNCLGLNSLFVKCFEDDVVEGLK